MLLLNKLKELQLRINEFHEMSRFIVATIKEESKEKEVCLESLTNN